MSARIHRWGLVLLVVLASGAGVSAVRAADAPSGWDREAAYAAREAELKQRIAAQPNDPGPRVELAAFYLNPTAPRRVQAADGQVRICPAPLRDEVVVGAIKDVYAVPWVFRGDPDAARPLLAEALRLDPSHHEAHRQTALYYRMIQNVDEMQKHVLAALKVNGLDLAMCRLYLDYHTVRARVLNDEATRLRTPTEYIEERPDGRYRVTKFPSEAAKTRAGQLDAQAQQHRREAIEPLKQMVMKIKGKPEHRSTHDLANAVYYHWIGKLDTAGGAAKAALAADPTNLDALDYLIDLTRGTHTKDLYDHYRAIRDRWAGADTRIRTAPQEQAGPKR